VGADAMSDLPPGFELDQAPAAAPPLPPGFTLDAPSVGADVLKSGGIGLVKGAIGMAGAPADTNSLTKTIGSAVGNKLGISPETQSRIGSGFDLAAKAGVLGRMGSLGTISPRSSDIRSAIEKATGTFYEPQTKAGEYAQTVGELVPAALGGEGSLAPRLIKQALIPALASETAGQATQGTAAEPYARIAAAIAAPIGAGAIANAARRVVTPLPASPERLAAVQTLANEGVPVTAGQASGSNALRYMESSLGDAPFAGNQTSRTIERQGEAFTQAALSRVGENATRATPEVVDRAFARIGNNFDQLAARNTMAADRRLGNDLNTTELQYNRMTPPNARAPVVSEMINDIQDIAARNGNALPGDQYQAFRSRLDRAARASRADPQLSGALFDIRNALDDAMQRSINPADRGAWQEARRQYRNMLVIEEAATGAGENAAQGIISPAALRNATVVQNRRAYARGQGDFADLAHAGETLVRPMPQSGTAPRAFAAAMPAIVGAGIAGGPGAALGAAGSVVAPGLAGRALMSRPVQGYLGNQLLPQRNLPPDRLAMLRRLLLANAATTPMRQLPAPSSNSQ